MAFNYSAVIRTLGTAGEKYQKLLNSLVSQTIPPDAIYIYIAEGYPIPKETVGKEKYYYVKKGMMAQRALDYDQVKSEYILFLDDDLEFPDNTVEIMSDLLFSYNADVISPDIFKNSNRKLITEILMTLSGRMVPRLRESKWGYKIMSNGGYSYVKHPKHDVYESQTNAGACFLCKKNSFLSIDLQDELWIDRLPYAIGDDQIMYYKMYKRGLKSITWYKHGVIHLDAGNNMTLEKEKARLYGDTYFKIIFWHRFIFMPEKNTLLRMKVCLALMYTFLMSLLISIIKMRFDMLSMKYNAILDAIGFIKSKEYTNLPLI